MQDINPSQPTDSMIGKLLVASTSVQDPLLSRSVCLVVHQDTDNVFAVLLNRPMTPPPGLIKLLSSTGGREPAAGLTDASPGNRWASSAKPTSVSFPTNLPGSVSPPLPSQAEGDKHSLAERTASEASKSLGTIHFGGPLSGPVVAVHNSSEYAEAQAGRGVYVAAQRELLETLVKQKPGSFRLIVGHLGWSVDQLAAEREAGLWHTLEATDEDVFTGDQDLWPSVIRRATTGSVAAWLGIKNTPFAADVN